MLEDSYICEASINGAVILKERLWDSILKMDISKPNGKIIVAGFELERYNNIITYWSIMFETHGGF